MPPLSCTLSCEYLCKFSKTFEMALKGYSRACGKLLYENNLKSKLSWQCPFNSTPRAVFPNPRGSAAICLIPLFDQRRFIVHIYISYFRLFDLVCCFLQLAIKFHHYSTTMISRLRYLLRTCAESERWNGNG